MAGQTAADRLRGVDLLDLRLFVAVVEAGSITHGARRVHLALPSASARVRQLERATGAPLLERGRRGVTPTRAGRLLDRHARTVLGDVDRMHGELAEHVAGPAATVRLRANTATVCTLLPDLLIPFLAAHPGVDVDLTEEPSHRIVAAVAEGRVDLGIVASTVDTGRLHRVRLRPDRLVVAVPAGHPLARRRAVAFADCLDHGFVGLAAGNPLQEHLEGKAQPFGQRPSYRVRLPTTEDVRRTVAAGIGIAVLPEAALPTADASGADASGAGPSGPGPSGPRLVTVALTDPWADRELLLCSPPDATPTRPVRLLAEHLVRAASAGP